MMNAIKKAQSLQKHVVIAGCVPQADRNLKGLEHVSLIGTEQITSKQCIFFSTVNTVNWNILSEILDVFDETIKGNRVLMLEKGELPTLNIPKIRRNRLIESTFFNTVIWDL
jgi:threonylcarbamoyladenosine tRNA methylthiotransferase CDKAL1